MIDWIARGKGWFKKVRNREWVLGLGIILLLCGVYMLGADHAAASPDAVLPASQQEAEQLEALLESIQGVGDTRVMVTYGEPATRVSAQDDGRTETVSYSPVQGVVVVAEGAHDLHIRLKVQSAVRTALDLPITQIEVLAMDE